MVRAILDDRKTQTRRVITAANSVIGEGGDWSKLDWGGEAINIFYRGSQGQKKTKAPLPFVDGTPATGEYLHVPYNWTEDQTVYRVYPRWEVGARLWVREAYWEQSGDLYFKADWPQEQPVNMACDHGKWRPSIFMPRCASRILLEIIKVRAQRLQEITEGDAQAEGFHTCPVPPFGGVDMATAQYLFCGYWDSLNAKRGYGWDANPWCWCLTFKRIDQEGRMPDKKKGQAT